MISTDPGDLEAMKEAERNPISVVLSDWDHLTGSEYMQAMDDTGYDILYVLSTKCQRSNADQT